MVLPDPWWWCFQLVYLSQVTTLLPNSKVTTSIAVLYYYQNIEKLPYGQEWFPLYSHLTGLIVGLIFGLKSNWSPKVRSIDHYRFCKASSLLGECPINMVVQVMLLRPFVFGQVGRYDTQASSMSVKVLHQYGWQQCFQVFLRPSNLTGTIRSPQSVKFIR